MPGFGGPTCAASIQAVAGSLIIEGVILVNHGSRLHLQPFVAVALKLKEYGHRVRVATHSPFRAFVEQFGLEMFPLGGDPEVLAEFAVQSKGARSLMKRTSGLGTACIAYIAMHVA